MGIMIPYSSYNPTDAPIIKNAITVAVCNCSFSFLAGFGVFAIVGYLEGLNSEVAGNVSSMGLAFIAYPAALETLPGANFWSLMFAMTLFMLGIDSSFSIVESVCTVIHDTKFGGRINKTLLCLILCIMGMVGSTFFCFNWGFTLFDIVDHYLNVYLVLFMGILECFGAGWVHCIEDAMSKGGKCSTLTLVCGYWIMMQILPWPMYFGAGDYSNISVPIYWGFMIIIWTISACTCKAGFKTWYNEVFFYGVKPISVHLLKLQKIENKFLVNLFEFWWCFCIKYLVPWAIYWLIVMTMAKDVENRYGEYYWGW